MSAHAVFTAGSTPRGVTPPTEPSGRGGFLSDVIVELGFADRATVEQAVRAARSPGTTVARVLVERGDITEDQLAHATAERHGLAYVDLDAYEVEPAAANLLGPAALAPLLRRWESPSPRDAVLVAMADPRRPAQHQGHLRAHRDGGGARRWPPRRRSWPWWTACPCPTRCAGRCGVPTEAQPRMQQPTPAPRGGAAGRAGGGDARRLAATAGELEARPA